MLFNPCTVMSCRWFLVVDWLTVFSRTHAATHDDNQLFVIMNPTEFTEQLPDIINPSKNDIIQRLQTHDALEMLHRLPQFPPSKLRAAVLVPLFMRNGKLHVLLTQRSELLRTHGGEVALPGGMQDESDESYQDTALRESFEEVGLPRQSVHIISHLVPTFAKKGTLVVPLVGFIPDDFIAIPNPAEVQQVFSIPLDNFLRSENYWNIILMENIGGRSFYLHGFRHDIGHESYTTFGLTAAILVVTASICFAQSPQFPWGYQHDQFDVKNPFAFFEKYYMHEIGKLNDETSKL